MENKRSPSFRAVLGAGVMVVVAAGGCAKLGLDGLSSSVSSVSESEATPSRKAGGKSIGQLEGADPKAALATWTAAQQWRPGRDWGLGYGYDSLAGGAALADELGEHLSELGRASWIIKCLGNQNEDATATLAWAICGGDVAALDLKKLEAELGAADISADSQDNVLREAREALEDAKKVGEAVTAAAKSDPGVASLLKLAAEARTEWAAYASSHKDRIAQFLALKDAVRSSRTTAPAFTGCNDATQPAFAKLVRGTKLPLDGGRDPMLSYASLLHTSIDGYLVSVSYGACAFGLHESGEALFVALADVPGGHARFGARSLALAKILDPGFAPKFSDRELDFKKMTFEWRYGVEVPGARSFLATTNPSAGIVAAVKPAGDVATVSFKSASYEACVEWMDTNRVERVHPDGTVSYQKECKRRGKVETEAKPITSSTKFLGGVSAGVQLYAVANFPAVVTKGNRLIAVFGVTLN